MIAFEPASDLALRYIGAHLRQQDRVELSVTCPGQDVTDVLLRSRRDSRWATVVKVDGLPAIVYGVAPTSDPRVGSPWMLATPDLRRIRKFFIQHGGLEVRLMQQTFPVLWNRVHKGNTCAIRWLESLGFTIHRDKPRGDLFDFSKGLR